MSPRASEPLGRPKILAIYEAAERGHPDRHAQCQHQRRLIDRLRLADLLQCRSIPFLPHSRP